MTYTCDRCGAPLAGGATACGRCGKRFDAPVPWEDDLLRGRTAGGSPASGPAPAAYYAAPPPPTVPKPRRVRAWLIGGLVGLVALLALAGWGVRALWMRGAGGEIAYRQHNLAGNAATERGDFSTADDEYGLMIALRPRRVDGYLLRGISEFKEGKLTESAADDTTALGLTQEPTMRGDLLYNRGEAYAKRGSQTKAIADYTQSLSEYARERNARMHWMTASRQADDYRQRGEAHWQHKDYAQAAGDCGAAIALGHPHPDDYGIRGKAELSLGRNAAAQADFTQALALDPEYLDGYVGLGDLADKTHQYAQAVAVFRRATEVSPRTPQFWGSLGWFQYEAGQTSQAIASDRHAQSLDPRQAWVNYNLALAYAASGDGARASAAYADAMADHSPTDRQAALKDLQAALAKQPGSSVLRQAVAQVERGNAGTGRVARLLPPAPLPVPETPAPRPPAAFASSLGPEAALDGYGIQPPRGYVLTQTRQESLTGTGTVYLWSGPKRSDGTAPTLEVTVAQDDGSLAARMTAPQLTQMRLSNMNANHSRLTLSPVTACALNGLPFARGDWDGVGVKTGKEYAGSEYWLLSPSHVLGLSSHDALPYSHDTLPLLRASIGTFRRR